MRVAVCVSGQCVSKNPNTNIKDNISRLMDALPNADFYFASWVQYEKTFIDIFPDQHCFLFEEPSINYHPYDIPANKWVSNRFASAREFIKNGGEHSWEWSRHHTKQILIHSWLCEKLPNEYDVIVRTRFDVWVSYKANLLPYIEDTFYNNRVNAITATKRKGFNELRQFDASPGASHDQWLVDQMIIHPMKILDFTHVNELHAKCVLHPAEMGWFQVLSKENFPHHRSFDGWVNHDKNINTEYFYKDVFDILRRRPWAIMDCLKELFFQQVVVQIIRPIRAIRKVTKAFWTTLSSS